MTVSGVAITEPDEQTGPLIGLIVILIGLRGRAALSTIRALTREYPVAIATKGLVSDFETVRDELTTAGVGLLVVDPSVRWEFFEAVVQRQLSDQGHPDIQALADPKDLFAIAEATAVLTGGHVVIDDTACRVLAYSAMDEDVDNQRRLTILSRQGPETYMRHLTNRGAFRRLHETEGPVYVEALPEIGVHRRIAISIRINGRVVGHIWVLEGKTPFSTQCERALIGAAKHVAARLADQENDDRFAARVEQVASLLGEPPHVRAVARRLEIDENQPANIVLFNTCNGDLESTALRSLRGEFVHMVSIHAAAYGTRVVVGQLHSHVAMILPMLDKLRSPPAIRRLVTEIVRDGRVHFGIAIQGAIGPLSDSLLELAVSYDKTRRVVRILAATPDVTTASYEDLMAQVLLDEVFELMQGRTSISHPGLDRLICDNSSMAHTLLAYLEAFGDTKTAASILNVHRNTVRYRAHRACEIAGIDLENPEHRLAAHLQLRQWRRYERLPNNQPI